MGFPLVFSAISPSEEKRRPLQGLVYCLLCVRSLATVNRARIPQVPKEHDNEGECKAGSQDRDSDRSNDRHFRGSERSTVTLCRRRPPSSVPTQTGELPVFPANPAELVNRTDSETKD